MCGLGGPGGRALRHGGRAARARRVAGARRAVAVAGEKETDPYEEKPRGATEKKPRGAQVCVWAESGREIDSSRLRCHMKLPTLR